VRLEPSAYYVGPSPYLSALELRFYPDHPSLFAAFAAGEIDGISRVLPADIDVAVGREDLQLFSSMQSEYLSIVLNLNNPDVPFMQDKRVRQALHYGIDREGLIEDVLDGQGIVAHSLLLPENWAYNSDVRQYPYDPELANQLLDEAGWIDSDGDGVRDQNGQPLQFLLHTNDESSRVAVIERIAQDWQKLGIRVVASPVTFSGLVGDLLAPRRFDAVLIKWELTGDPDQYPLWHSTQIEGGGQNYGGWSNEVADGLLEEGRAITDMDERRALYADFQEIFTEELPALLLYYPVYTYGVSDEVQNVQIGSLNQPSQRFETFADWYMVTRRVPAGQVGPDVPLAAPGGVEDREGE
jgi:peptide/nickel transport system substrate-binding protein